MMLASSVALSLSGRASNQVRARSSDFGRVVRFGAGALQHEAVEGGEFVGVEAQRRAAAGQRVASSVRVQSRTGMKL